MAKDLHVRIYNLYQLDWLARHGFSLQDIITAMDEHYQMLAAYDSNDEQIYDKSPMALYSNVVYMRSCILCRTI